MFDVNPAARAEPRRIDEDAHLIVVDDFLADPGSVREYALAHQDGFLAPERSYPGRVVDVEAALLVPVYDWVRKRMSRDFYFLRGDIVFSTQLSITCQAPETFNWLQRMPHTDPQAGEGRRNYAGLVYLFEDERLGGTGFYRWRDPQFLVSVSRREQKDPEGAMRLLEQRYPEFAEPPAYITGSTEFAELLLHVPARYNRLLFYSGDVPHSAFIEAPELLTDDPTKGRLTLNVFASVTPR